MSIEKKYEELIENSYRELETLKNEVTQLEDIRKNIENLIGSNNELPIIFEEKFKKIIKLSEDYSNTLGVATKNYLDGNNTLFTTRLSEFREKTKEFQNQLDGLKRQIEQLEKIDLEKNFDKLQKTLTEIFGAINAINLTLTNIIQTITGIVQSLGTIQTTLDTNHKEVRQLLNTFSEATEKHLADQDKQATKNVELLDSKIKSLSEQNELLRKEVKTNRIIQIVGLTIILIILIYVVYKL